LRNPRLINNKIPVGNCSSESFKGVNQSQDKDVKVLVYWDNPTIMIFEPIHFANTKYINKKYEHNERTIEVIIGKED